MKPMASFQVEGGYNTLAYLMEGIVQVTETTNQLREQLAILVDQQSMTHREM